MTAKVKGEFTLGEELKDTGSEVSRYSQWLSLDPPQGLTAVWSESEEGSRYYLIQEVAKHLREPSSQTQEEVGYSKILECFLSSQQRTQTIPLLGSEISSLTLSIFSGLRGLSPKSGKLHSVEEILNSFANRVSEIQEVQQVLAYIIDDFIDVYTIFNSAAEQTYDSIYQAEQNTLKVSDWESIDFHTINLADFPHEQWPQLIPKDAQIVFKRE